MQEDEDGCDYVDGDGDDGDGEDDYHEMTFSNVLPSNQATKASIGRKVLGSSNFISAGKPHGVNFIVCIMTRPLLKGLADASVLLTICDLLRSLVVLAASGILY